MPDDLSVPLASFVVRTTACGAPAAVRDQAADILIDTLAACYATLPVQPRHADLLARIRSWGGTQAATIIGHDVRTCAPFAALANGALARGANLDDCHDPGGTHPSAVVVPAVLALAEEVRSTGSELLTAIAIGDEVVCRLGAAAAHGGAVPMERWFVTSVLGIFGATAGCCSILKLDAATVQSAFGIALAQTSGTLEPFSPEGQTSSMRGMVAGFAAQAAVVSACLAASGISGPSRVIDGRYGLNAAYLDGRLARDAMLAGLGDDWRIAEIGQKAWPVVRYLNGYVDATRLLVGRTGLTTSAITRVEAHVAGYVRKFFHPTQTQARPVNYDNAVHALPFLIALMAVRGDITPRLILDNLDDAEVLRLAGMVTARQDDAFGADNRPGPGKITVHATTGEIHACVVRRSLGDPLNPLGRAGIRRKFLSCCEHAAAAPEGDVAYHGLRQTDDAPDAAALIARLRL